MQEELVPNMEISPLERLQCSLKVKEDLSYDLIFRVRKITFRTD